MSISHMFVVAIGVMLGISKMWYAHSGVRLSHHNGKNNIGKCVLLLSLEEELPGIYSDRALVKP